MHIHDVMAAADHRMVQGRDWLFDFLGKDCREVIFESYGLHDSDEHYPVDAIFCCTDGSVRQITVVLDDAKSWRWMDPACHAGYILACADAGVEPWAEPDIVWLHDPQQILPLIRPALHPERRPSDADESYRWIQDGEGFEERDEQPGDVSINPT